MKVIRNLAIIASIAVLVSQVYAWGAPSRVPAQARRAHYALQSDLWGYPYTLKLRHCAPSEDVLVELRMVDYRPADGVVVYRCVTP